jgi:hypothetical protein
VLVDTLRQVRRDAGVERAAAVAGNDVDAGARGVGIPDGDWRRSTGLYESACAATREAPGSGPWIASSQGLLAMTGLSRKGAVASSLGRWLRFPSALIKPELRICRGLSDRVHVRLTPSARSSSAPIVFAGSLA